MPNQPFYGKLSNFTPSDTQITLIKGDTSVGSNQVTNIIPFNSGYDIGLLRVGQVLRDVQNKFGQNVLISGISGTTLTVTDLSGGAITATSAATEAIFPVDLTGGNYYVASASFYDPNTDLVVTDIIGTNDGGFSGPTYSVLGVGARASNGNPYKGIFNKYTVTDVSLMPE